MAACSKCAKRRARPGQRYCGPCHTLYMREWRRGRGGHASLTPEQKARASARSYAREYQKRGKLVPSPCEVCGAKKVQRHHPDYSQPLLVRWLCKAHHLDLHYGINRPQRVAQLGLFEEAA